MEKDAASNSKVSICGKSGAGKELVINAIPHNSNRRTQRFDTVNKAAIPSGLAESHLLGHEKAAISGTSAPKKGKFEKPMKAIFS